MMENNVWKFGKDTLTFNEEKHFYSLNNIPMAGVSSILKRAGICSDFSAVPPEVLQRAAEFGKVVHAVCEFHGKKTLDIATIAPPVMPYYEAYLSFLRDYDVEIVEVEQPVFSKRFWYAGRLDLLAKIHGKLTICDLKSTANMAVTERIKLAGYKIAREEMFFDKIPGRWGVLLQKDSKYQVFPYNDESDLDVFIAACQVSKWKKKYMSDNYSKGEQK